jgi:hypothetical protein
MSQIPCDDKVEEDEFPMLPALERYPVRIHGRPYRCPYCHQKIVSGMMTIQRKFKLGRNPKAQKIILSWWHVPCWVELDGRIENEMYWLERNVVHRFKAESVLTTLAKLRELST